MMPCLRIGYGTLHCLTPFRIVHSPFSLCVCCHSIVDLVLCLVGTVVSLWNSGDDLCEAEGRVVSIVHCQLFACCGVCVVLLCCVVEWRWCAGGGLALVFLFPLSSSSVSFVGGVRGSARAAPASTHVIPEHRRVPLLSSLLPAFLRAPPFLLLWNGGG